MNKSNFTNTCNTERKSVRDLDLINSFLFRALTENPECAKFIAKLVIERATGRSVEQISVVSEKTLMGIDLGQHGICMDLYVEEYEGERCARVYDIEPNNYGADELPMRSRYSQALTDVKLLKAGEDYKKLPNYISIWILPYDPFGQNRMLYTVKNFVAENTQIVYNDGALKLFLYTDGEIGGNEKLKDMLRYFAESDEENAVDPELSQLHDFVQKVRDNRKVGEQFMTLQDYLDNEIKRGVEEGIARALDAAVAEAVDAAVDAAVAEAVDAAVAEAVDAAVAEAVDAAVEKTVAMLKDLNVSKEQIVEQLMEKYSLTEEKAKSFLN